MPQSKPTTLSSRATRRGLITTACTRLRGVDYQSSSITRTNQRRQKCTLGSAQENVFIVIEVWPVSL